MVVNTHTWRIFFRSRIKAISLCRSGPGSRLQCISNLRRIAVDDAWPGPGSRLQGVNNLRRIAVDDAWRSALYLAWLCSQQPD